MGYLTANGLARGATIHRWALTNGRVLDGDPRGYAGPGGVVVEGGRILEAGPRVNADAVADLPIVDLNGRTVMPGLIDCHVHLAFSAGATPVQTLVEELRQPTQLALRVAANATTILARGVTTVRDLGGPNRPLFDLRDLTGSHQLIGPRVLAAGMMITKPTGHCHFMGRWARGPVEIERAVRRQLEVGADVIKIVVTGGVHTIGTSPLDVQYDRRTIRAAVAAAHAGGVRITCHATNALGIDRALAAGVDSIQHGGEITGRTASAMAEGGVSLTPTLSTRHAIELFGGDPAVPPYITAKMAATKAQRLAGLRRALAAGVAIAAGTDSGTTHVPHGSTATEVLLLGESGLSARLALASATSVAAVEIGLGGQLGVLASGAIADLIVVDGDPLLALTNLEKVVLVIRDGRAAAGPWLHTVTPGIRLSARGTAA